MVTLNVTQYLRPYAEKRPLSLEVSDEAGLKWKGEIEPLGLRLTAEMIPMGSLQPEGGRTEEEQVCVAIENPDWGDFRMIICHNIPGGPVAREVEKMILAFDEDDYHTWVRMLEEDED